MHLQQDRKNLSAPENQDKGEYNALRYSMGEDQLAISKCQRSPFSSCTQTVMLEAVNGC
jgi:hypothetical protein